MERFIFVFPQNNQQDSAVEPHTHVQHEKNKMRVEGAMVDEKGMCKKIISKGLWSLSFGVDDGR